MDLSQPELAKKAKVGQSTISDLENDKKGTSAEKMDAIAEALNTTTKFLLSGKDESFTPNDEQKAEFKFESQKERSIEILKQIVSPHSSNEVEIRYFDELQVSCGFGSFGEVLEKDAKKLTISKKPLQDRNINPRDCVALPATGDSMYPTIKDKDTVYVDLARNTIKDGKIFAICHGGLFKFKRLYQLPLGGVRIVSDNAIEYPEERLTAQEIIDQQFEIIGWAWSWQSMENW
jgi:phage repressor protein C with HTH and peptisase S24 domain